jgi:histidine triad (HIT) family protein
MCGKASPYRSGQFKFFLLLQGSASKAVEAGNGQRPSAHQAAQPQQFGEMPEWSSAMNSTCLFCKVVSRDLAARIVFEDEVSLAFLDHRPVFPGHCLLIPKDHFETLIDLPTNLIGPFFQSAQLLSRAVESAMEAHGTFVAMNNRVSQSVPHLHVHIVPRRRKDGLKGFFWPRYPYKSEDEADAVQSVICGAVDALTK